MEKLALSIYKMNSDKEEIKALYQLLQLEEHKQYFNFVRYDSIQKDYEAKNIIIEKKGADILGFVTIHKYKSKATAYMCDAGDIRIKQIVVSPKYQRQGVGSLLIQKTVDFAKQIKAKKIVLTVEDDNKKAIAFYEKHNFQNVNEGYWNKNKGKVRYLVFSKNVEKQQQVQLDVFGKPIRDGIDVLLDVYPKLCSCLNTNKSLLMSPFEFILNRKPGTRKAVFKNDGCLLYDKNDIYIVIGDKNIDETDKAFLSIRKPENASYKTRKEYIYVCEDVNNLVGKQFKSIRRYYKKTEKLNKYSIEVSQDKNEMFSMYTAWKNTIGKKYFQIHDTTLHKNYVKYWEKIRRNILMYFLKYDNKNVGFILLEKTNKDFVYLMSRKVLEKHIEHTAFFQVNVIRELFNLGYKYVSDGGGGTKGLKLFKEKFNPKILNTYTYEKKR